MAFVVNDRVKETTTDTGTTTIDLAGAETGFETFVAGIGSTNQTYYCIQAQGGSAFEIGVGTVTSGSPDTLSRTSVISSSNADGLVDFGAGTKDVFCTLPASKAVIEDNSTNANIAGNLTLGGTVDGVDIAARDAVLTSTTTTANAALPKAGGTMSGNLVLSGANITMSGSETVDGVDISARDTVLTNTTTTANAALPKAGGTMTGNISHASDFTLDMGGEINLDADGGKVRFKDAGTEIGRVVIDNNQDLEIVASVDDKDIKFRGSDGGSNVTALTLDMSSEGSLVVNSNVKYPDNGKAIFGAGTDLQIYHDATDNNSYIDENGAGSLIIRGNNLLLKKYTGETYVNCVADGAVELYHDNTKVAETTTDGIDMPDSKKLQLGDGDDLQLFHDTANSQIINNTGALKFRSDSYTIRSNDDATNSIIATPATAVELYYNGTKMFSTTSEGVQVEADKRLVIINGANWSGELVGKIEHHSNNMYHQFNSNFICRNSSGSNVFTLDSSGNGTFNANVTAYSDIRLKEDVKTIDNALDKVCKLRGVEYTRKQTGAREIGVIANEVKEVVPELVTVTDLRSDINPDELNDVHTMKYQNTVGLLIEAIKDLKAEIEELKKAK